MSIKCKKCGTELPDNASYCYNCGNVIEASPLNASAPVQQPAQKNKAPIIITSISLAVVLALAAVCIVVLSKREDGQTDKKHKATTEISEEYGETEKAEKTESTTVPFSQIGVEDTTSAAGYTEVGGTSDPQNGAYPAAGTSVPSTDDGSAYPVTPTAATTTTAATTKPYTSPAKPIPQTKAEILKVYNDATAKAVKAAVPFQKDRTTSEKQAMQGGAALMAFKDVVYKFVGVGDANKFSKTVTAEDKDSYQKYFQASKLTEADITNATCKQSGDNYLITINLKDGSSKVEGGKTISSNNSPLDRSGLACGADDKDYWDHKTAQNVMAAIDDVPGCTGANINESYTGAVINVVINAKTGNIVQLGASFSFTFSLEKVLASNGTAEAVTTVIFKDFRY